MDNEVTEVTEDYEIHEGDIEAERIYAMSAIRIETNGQMQSEEIAVKQDTWYVTPANASRINKLVQRAVNRDTTRKKIGRKLMAMAGGLGYIRGFTSNMHRVFDPQGHIREASYAGYYAAESMFDNRELQLREMMDDARQGQLLGGGREFKSPLHAMNAMLKMGITAKDCNEILNQIKDSPKQLQAAQD